MKLRNIILAIALGAMTISMTGCDSYLDIDPENKPPETEVDYTNTDNMYMPVSGIYAKVRTGACHWVIWPLSNVRDDDMWSGRLDDQQYLVDFDNCERKRPNEMEHFGAVTAYTAELLAAKVRLEREEWSEAETLTSDIISSGKFSLYADYYELFKIKGKECDGSLFEVQCTDFGQSSASLLCHRPMHHRAHDRELSHGSLVEAFHELSRDSAGAQQAWFQIQLKYIIQLIICIVLW